MFFKKKNTHNILLEDVIRGIGISIIHSKTDLDNHSIRQKDRHDHKILKNLPHFLFYISDVNVRIRFEIKKIQDDGNVQVNMCPNDSNKTQEISYKLQQKSFS